jgi:hypothetical protein
VLSAALSVAAVTIKLAPGQSPAEIEKAIHANYSDACNRPEHNYAVWELGKPCVPVLTAEELKKLERIYNAQPQDRQMYVRFAFDPAGGTFNGRFVVIQQFIVLDAYPATFPNGALAKESQSRSYFRVFGNDRVMYEPEENRSVPIPP